MEKSKRISTELIIKASVEQIWSVLFGQFGEVYLFNPSIIGSHFTKGEQGQVGCERECSLNSKTYVKERIIEADEFKSFKLEIFDNNMPLLDRMEALFSLVSLNTNETRVIVFGEFNTKPRLARLLLSGAFRKRLSDLLIGLKYYLETGRTISPKSFGLIRKRYFTMELSEAFQ